MALNLCELKALCEVCRPWQDEMQREPSRRTCLRIDFTFAQIAKSVAAGAAAILESPERSHLRGFQQLKDIRKMPGWRRTLYDACCWGGARKKKQALESNVPEIQAMHSSCHHVHSKPDWTPYHGIGGTMIYPSSGEAGRRCIRHSGCPELVGSSQRQSQVARPTGPYSAGGR